MSSPKIKLLLILGLIIGTIFQSLPVIRSGLLYNYGYGFWGPTGHDGIFHLSLINHIYNPFSILHPSISGQLLKNYHPFYDIIIKFASSITSVDTSLLNFQIAPLTLSALMIILSYKLGKYLTKSMYGGIILAFLNCTATSLGWIYTLITSGRIGGESFFWSMQSSSTQLNPPFALSIIFVLLFLYLLFTKKYPILIILIAILTPITKSYAGILIYFILFLFALKNTKYFIYLGISLIFSIPLFLLFNSSSSNLFVWQPLWFVNSMLSSPDRFYIPKVASFINTSISGSNFSLRFVIVEFIGILIFIIGNYSWRILGLFSIRSKDKNLSLILIPLLIFTIIPLLIIQKGTPWNTIQFLYYGQILGNILLTVFLYQKKSYLLTSLIIVTTLIANMPVLTSSLGNPSPSALPPSEISALKYLSNLPGKTILSYPYDPFIRNHYQNTPLPLFAYETTAYVSAYTKKYSYLEDEMNLNISGYEYLPRLNQSKDFFLQKNIYQDRGFLVNNYIDYIYLADKSLQKFNPDETNLGIKKIYDQDNVVIYQVNR